MVFGTLLRLPGEYFSNYVDILSHVDHVAHLQNFVRCLKPVPVRKATSRTTQVRKKLFACSHVCVRHDEVKLTLQKLYYDSFEVIERSEKYFKINPKGTIDNSIKQIGTN